MYILQDEGRMFLCIYRREMHNYRSSTLLRIQIQMSYCAANSFQLMYRVNALLHLKIFLYSYGFLPNMNAICCMIYCAGLLANDVRFVYKGYLTSCHLVLIGV